MQSRFENAEADTKRLEDEQKKNEELLGKIEFLESEIEKHAKKHKETAKNLQTQVEHYGEKYEKSKAKIQEHEKYVHKSRAENADLQQQIKELINSFKKSEKWNEDMNGVNQAQYEKIKTLKADLQRYKDFKADLQKRVDRMEKDKKTFKAKIDEQKAEKKKNLEIIENFKGIQEQMINQYKPTNEKITVSTETLIEALNKAKKYNERQKFKSKVKKGESKEQND